MFDAKFASHSFDNQESSLYDILDVKPEASPTEIRDSYLRIKNTYSKDSVALYTLVDPSEREDILKKIEQAYAILSNPVARREYDQSSHTLSSTPWYEPHSDAGPATNVVSIDRVPPMESVENAERALVAPVTDFGFPTHAKAPTNAPPAFNNESAAIERGSLIEETAATLEAMPAPVVSDIEVEIQSENEWSGAFLRKVREARGISIEEIIQATRITRAYVLAIEDENFNKLPAPVYVRGFVNQISRILRVANKDVAAAYMRRCQRLHPEKFR
jgi:flagellar biosynthesis protein FlhG